MQREPTRAGGVSWGVQGCLVASVGLFVVLLVVILFILFQQLRTPPEPVLPPATGTPVLPPSP